MAIDCEHHGQSTKPVPTGAVATTDLFVEQEEAQGRSFRLDGADPSRGRDSLVRPSSTTSARSARANGSSSASARATPTPATTPISAPINTAPDNTESILRAYQPKRRYFLVFLDVGQALHDLTSLPMLFQALKDVIFGNLFLQRF